MLYIVLIIEQNWNVSPANEHTNNKIWGFCLFPFLFTYYSPSLAVSLPASIPILSLFQPFIVHSFSPLNYCILCLIIRFHLVLLYFPYYSCIAGIASLYSPSPTIFIYCVGSFWNVGWGCFRIGCLFIYLFINCNWVVTRWQWLFYMYTKHEIGHY